MAARIFDDNDWQAFSGAECFPNGFQPVIDDGDEDFIFIGCGTGIEVYEKSLLAAEHPLDVGPWRLRMLIPNAGVARLIIDNLGEQIPDMTRKQLLDLGFSR